MITYWISLPNINIPFRCRVLSLKEKMYLIFPLCRKIGSTDPSGSRPRSWVFSWTKYQMGNKQNSEVSYQTNRTPWIKWKRFMLSKNVFSRFSRHSSRRSERTFRTAHTTAVVKLSLLRVLMTPSQVFLNVSWVRWGQPAASWAQGTGKSPLGPSQVSGGGGGGQSSGSG